MHTAVVLFHGTLSSLFFFHSFGDHRDLHSFPTRRSSDLRSIPRPLACCARSAPTTFAAVMLPPARCSARNALLRLRSEEHTSELQSRENLVCRLLLEKKNKSRKTPQYERAVAAVRLLLLL